MLYGQFNPSAKLTDEDVTQVFALLKRGSFSQEEIGKMFNVCQKTISNINTMTNWRHMSEALIENAEKEQR